MITSGIDMKGFITSRDLKSAIKEVYRFQGLELVKRAPEDLSR
jgi:hypothetical protein